MRGFAAISPLLCLGFGGCYDFSSLSAGYGRGEAGIAQADLAGSAGMDAAVVADLSQSIGIPDLTGMGPPPDLAARPPDLANIPDLSVIPPDLAGQPPPDLAGQPPPDLAMSLPDLAQSPPDLSQSPPDLAVRPPDLAVLPDLVVLPDLATPPDLAVVRGLTLSFGAPSSVSTTNAYYQFALADYNADGNLDVGGAGSGSVGVMPGAGNGTFQAAIVNTMSPSPQDLAARDLNGDGAIDVAVACGNINTSTALLVAFGKNTGQFQAPVSYPVGFWPTSVAIGDVDANGSPDVVVLDADNTSIRTFANRGNGTFMMQQSVPMAGYGVNSILVADFNLDKKGDLAVASATNKPGNSGSVNVLVGNGNGYAAAVDYSTSFACNNLAAGDLNGDAIPDLVTANSFNGNASVLVGKGDGTFAAAKNYAAQAGSYSVALADFDKDAKLDAAVVNRDANSVTVFLGVGDGTLKAGATIALGVQLGSYEQDIAAGDFNGDGKPDLVVTHPAGKAMLVILNTSK